MKKDMKPYQYTITACSPVILSPRSSAAFYKGIDYPEDLLPYNIVYPFYQYGEYHEYRADANYYVPGSSVKGAILQGAVSEESLYFDDAKVNACDIGFASIFHAAYIRFLFPETYPRKTAQDNTEAGHLPTFKPFFDSTTGVQCLLKDRSVTGVAFSAGDLFKYVAHADQAVRARLEEYNCQLVRLQNRTNDDRVFQSYMDKRKKDQQGQGTLAAKRECFQTNLEIIRKNVDALLKETAGEHLLFLGGYKGLLRSVAALKGDELYEKENPLSSAVTVNATAIKRTASPGNPQPDTPGILFDVNATNVLPFGIVKIEIRSDIHA